MADHNILAACQLCWHPYFLLAMALAIAKPKGLSASDRMCRHACTGADCVDLWQPSRFEPISHALRYELGQLVDPDQYRAGRIVTAPIDWGHLSQAEAARAAEYLDRKLRSRAPHIQYIAPIDVLLPALLADIYAVA